MVLELNPLRWFHKPTPVPQLVFRPDPVEPTSVVKVPAAAAVEQQPASSSPAEAVELSMELTTPVTHAKVTWLTKAGDVLRNALGIGITVAKDAEPVVDMAVPEVALLYNGAVGLAVAAQATWNQANDDQKLSQVTAQLKPEIEKLFAGDEALFKTWMSTFVATLHLIPPPKTTSDTEVNS